MEFLQAFPIAIIDEDYDGKRAAGRGMRQLADGDREGRLSRRQRHRLRGCGAARRGLQQRIVLAGLGRWRRGRRRAWQRLEQHAGREAPAQRSAADLPVRRRAHRRDGSRARAPACQRLHAAVRGLARVPGARHRPLGAAVSGAPRAADVPGARWTTHCSASYSWHTPGHGGGVAFRKSPVGQLFYSFFGENTLRSDISVSVGSLGSLLDHTGPIAEGERNAARIFGADHTLFVVGGTSTANKIVWHGMVGRGDLVLCDRNCHKSILHSLVMTGATPIYLVPSRNGLGIIGPISREQFTPESIKPEDRSQPARAGDERQGAPDGDDQLDL